MKKIVLFDMDGTLTEPRKKIESSVVSALTKLTKGGFDIGVVTGSDREYVDQQLDCMFSIGGPGLDCVDLFPCNGTKHYTAKGRSNYKLTHSVNMINHIGQEDYNYLLETLFANQLAISCQYKIPLTGTFFQYRGSMLNWCPVGRKAGDSERSAWVKSDSKFKIRNHYMEQLNKVIEERNMCVTVALGGSTSFDIYPTGWDKTYVLKHLTLYDQIYFVGDKCKPGGNDHTLYEKLKKINKHDSFETESPENTVEIIEELMRKN